MGETRQPIHCKFNNHIVLTSRKVKLKKLVSHAEHNGNGHTVSGMTFALIDQNTAMTIVSSNYGKAGGPGPW